MTNPIISPLSLRVALIVGFLTIFSAGYALSASVPVRIDPEAPVTQPPYPAESKRLDEEGTVILKLDVLENGRVTTAEIEKSSGFKRLDDAAISHAVKQWRFLPATNDDIRTRSSHVIAVKFQMVKSKRF